MRSPDKKPKTKKPYQTPVIEKYGDIRKLTRNVGNTGMNDPGTGSKTMTGL